MSHFATLVIVPSETEDVEARVTELLAPYDENEEWFREGSRWDWWQIVLCARVRHQAGSLSVVASWRCVASSGRSCPLPPTNPHVQ